MWYSLYMEFRLGTCGWSFDDWKGPFYPAGCKDQLAYYAEQFDSVEIDSTWYHIPSRKVVESWYRRTPDAFRFSAKMPGEVTHERRFREAETVAAAFLSNIAGLEEKLAVILVQFSPRIQAGELTVVEDFLRGLPRDFDYAVEPRHKSWLQEPRLLELLRELDMAIVQADHAYYPFFDATTAGHAYVRLLGRHGAHPDVSRIHHRRDEDVRQWAERLTSLPDSIKRVFVYVNNQFEGHSPATVRKVRELLPGAWSPPSAQGMLDL